MALPGMARVRLIIRMRVRQCQYLADGLTANGVPVVQLQVDMNLY